jgi:hypothetical protein
MDFLVATLTWAMIWFVVVILLGLVIRRHR